MKKVFLHGELGEKFGKEWDLDVDSPFEAVSALFANHQEIEIYLNSKEREGVNYGIKKMPKGDFIEQIDYSLPTKKDIHIFPMPQGAGFAGGLIMTALTTAASMYVNKKIAEAMERDDSTLAIQTESFIFNGGENRYQQGSSVPVGYGRMKIGSNVVSACTVNYDYDSERGQVINFEDGLYSLVPGYSKHFIPEAGPLLSSFVSNLFDGKSDFKASDPAYQFLKKAIPNTYFGANDGIYGQYVDADTQRVETTTFKEKSGNSIGGYYYYEYNWFKGVNVAKMGTPGVGHDGNWIARSKADANYKVKESDAATSSYVCLQSVPTPDDSREPRDFYPVSFAKYGELEYIAGKDEPDPRFEGFFPIPVGQRWRNANKGDGVGWFKLESASVYKAIDLVCEGSIEGFCDKNGETLDFNKNAEKIDDPNDPKFLRNTGDDYLQGVILDDSQVKEVNLNTNKDAYNINEFDIDIAQNRSEVIGADDQGLLEPQYSFSANTKDVNAPLYGPREINTTNIIGSPNDLAEFQKNKPYAQGDYVSYQEGGGEKYAYKINSSLNNLFNRYGNHNYQNDDTEVVYVLNGDLAEFYLTAEAINEYQTFSGEYVDIQEPKLYQQGDKIRSRKYDGGMGYYEMGPDADRFLGVFNEELSYNGESGKVLMNPTTAGANTSSALYKITGDYDSVEGGGIISFASPISAKDEAGKKEVTSDPIYILNNSEDEEVSSKDWSTEIDVTPGNIAGMWQSIKINGVKDIKNGPGGPGVEGEDRTDLINKIFLLGGTADQESIRSSEEEYYVGHTVINPLVEEAYVTVQVDELAYIYEGDSVEITYEIGKLWTFIAGTLAAYYAYQAVKQAGQITFYASAQAVAGMSPGAAANSGLSIIDAKDKVLESVAHAIVWGAVALWMGAADAFKIGEKIENAGEIWPNKAKFRIKYGNEGEVPYSTDVYIYGVATSPYRKDIKIYLPPNPSRKDRNIKVYKLNRERNPVKEGEQAARYKERFSLAGITEITPVQLSYPNSVVIGTRVNARDVASIPKRNYHLKLKKVSIPSNYNPKTRQYDGNWDGRFKGQASKGDSVPEEAKLWTDNPAWCLYDLISNKRYGVGKFGIKPENIDRWTLYKVAKYCDQFVPTGYSSKYPKRDFETSGDKVIQISANNYDDADFQREFGYANKKLAFYYNHGLQESIKIISTSKSDKKITLETQPMQEFGECAVEIDYPLVEPRYTLNAFLMNPQNAFKLINEFASIFRAYAYWSGGAINFFQDEKKDSVMLFSNNNVSKEGFSYSSTPKTSRTNACKIKYVDKYNMFRAKMEYSEDRKAIQENNIIEQTIDGFGITSQSQAKRAADFLVKTANSESEILSFTTSSLGSYLKPGDVIDVLDNKRTIGRFAGKVVDVHVNGDGKTAEIKIDYPIRTVIDSDDGDTWKKITLYNISGNQTIESLDEMGTPTDEDIQNMRSSQIKDFVAYGISENDTKLKLLNNPYTLVTGEYTWVEALKDAEERGGILATVNDEMDQIMVQAVAPKDKFSWIGGYLMEEPPPEKFVWHQPQACDSNEITFFSWADGYPRLAKELQTDVLDSGNVLITDHMCGMGGELKITADSEFPGESFIAVSGSQDSSVHADWVTLSGDTKLGYILEKQADESLFKIRGIEGTTFMLEDTVNLAEPNKYKIINLTESSNGVYQIQGLEYNEDKFDNIEKDLSIKEPKSPVIFTENSIDPPTEITVEVLPENLNEKIPYGIKASWSMVEAAASYKVQFFNENILLATFEIPNDKTAGTISHEYRSERIVENGNYYARVYSIAR
tara:strand:- start:2595 stop:7973 length:5379 start_codon:yes stop_codon:yes gene_type:complete